MSAKGSKPHDFSVSISATKSKTKENKLFPQTKIQVALESSQSSQKDIIEKTLKKFANSIFQIASDFDEDLSIKY